MASNKLNTKRVTKQMIESFVSVTGATEDVGKSLLEACHGNLEMAVGMHLDSGQSSVSPQPDGGGGSPDHVNQLHQSPPPSDDVRAPIPQKHERLVEEARNFPGRRGRRRAARSVFDGFRDFRAEAQAQAEDGVTRKKLKTLEDLFRPPLDLLFKGSFKTACEAGSNKNLWLMVNIQNTKEFSCQMLNRDVWSNPAIKSIIKEHFLFWQVYDDSEEGEKFMQFYRISDWPYVAVIDPRTGEKLVHWSNLDPLTFSDLVTDFLTTNPSPDGTTHSPSKTSGNSSSVVDSSEESQMEAALLASLKETKSPVSKETTSKNKLKDSESDEYPTDSSMDEDAELETFTDSEEDSPKSKKSSKNSTPDSGSKKTSPKAKISPPGKGKGQGKKSTPKKTSPTMEKVSPKRRKRSSGGSSVSGSPPDKRRRNGACPAGDAKGVSKENVEEGSSAAEISSESDESWKTYLGLDSDPMIEVMIRFPDNSRKQLSLPNSSKLMALVKYVISNGFSNERYELVTTFPRRKLSHLDFDSTLEQIGLLAQESVFVQER